MKICFAASSGGHLEEIKQILEIGKENTTILLTEKSLFNEEAICDRCYYLNQINRRQAIFPLAFLRLWINSWRIFRKEKPDFVISTGALVTYPICVISKVFGKKVIYIESFARVNSQSMTGKLMYYVADLFIVQWEESVKYYPKAKFVGSIF